MRILVTGADGFAGGHLLEFLATNGDVAIPYAGPRPLGSMPHPSMPTLDIRDPAAVLAAVSSAAPAAVVHLAGVSSVALSHSEPRATFEVNALGALNLCLALRQVAPTACALLVGSGEVYGNLATESATERMPTAPSSPYAASKVAAEVIGFQFARSYGLRVISARPFNHLGAGQAPAFAMPSFARQIVEARRRGGHATLRVGNLDPIRDFSHVRDVVAAYRVLLERGVTGEPYNICSGHGRTIRSLLDELVELAGIAVDVEVDPSKLRPVDVPRLVGDATKLRELGWTATRTVREALDEVLLDAQKQAQTG